MRDHSRSVTMHCPTCGGTQFEYDNEIEDGPITCVGCDRRFTREELIKENGEHIEANLDEVKREIVSDFRDDLRMAFQGSKNVRWR
jgi:uncharacterized Zn finger protein (UPF0148 family)